MPPKDGSWPRVAPGPHRGAGGGPGRLDAREAEDPLRHGRVPDRRRVAHGTGQWRGRVDDQRHVPRADGLEDRGPSARPPGAPPPPRPPAASASARSGSWPLSRSAIESSATAPRGPGNGGRSEAASNAFAIATRASVWMPITSPVDCLAGPSEGSTPRSLAVEKTGALTATNGGSGSKPPSQPSSASVAPRAMRVARSTIGTPVTLERKGTVRLARGFTSIR